MASIRAGELILVRVEDDGSVTARRSGSYASTRTRVILYAQLRGRFAIELRNLGGDVFAPKANLDLRFVFTIDAGRAAEIAALRDGIVVWAGSRRP